MSDKFARVTFNQTADRRHFEGAKGIRIRLVDGGIYFHPAVTCEGQHIIPFLDSDTGRMADIDSIEPYSRRLMQILENVGYSTQEPFFILREASKGWIGIEHYPFNRPPAKNIPHFRVWPLRWSPSATPDRDNTFDMKAWQGTRQMVLRACEIIKDHEGRPPRPVQQVKDLVSSLNQLLTEVAKVEKSGKGRVFAVCPDANVSPAAPPADDVSGTVMRMMSERKRRRA